MVREGGVEPPHRKAPDPKSGASTSSATLARFTVRKHPYNSDNNTSQAELRKCFSPSLFQKRVAVFVLLAFVFFQPAL